MKHAYSATIFLHDSWEAPPDPVAALQPATAKDTPLLNYMKTRQSRVVSFSKWDNPIAPEY